MERQNDKLMLAVEIIENRELTVENSGSLFCNAALASTVAHVKEYSYAKKNTTQQTSLLSTYRNPGRWLQLEMPMSRRPEGNMGTLLPNGVHETQISSLETFKIAVPPLETWSIFQNNRKHSEDPDLATVYALGNLFFRIRYLYQHATVM